SNGCAAAWSNPPFARRSPVPPPCSSRACRANAYWFSWLGLAAPLGWVGFDVLSYLSPPPGTGGQRKVFVARLEKLRPGQVMALADLRGQPLVVLRPQDGPPRAISLVCTHLGCRVHWEARQQRFLCPCHLGFFDAQGNVVSGPPP